ncbi:hypothetical protein OUZ56_010037 [Daphnia magna]|uniref:THAP-type domain-containing protein n=1 Tax=Daphnia magna TaxID=35525 RepID=A0ABR0AHL8_9CRUS|nr:hypothetical protein OUZ56_010037 [Daphnia magna]
MVGRCAVPGCKTTYYKGNQKENDVTLFAVPKTSLSKWQELIPCSNLTSTSRICSRHFDESDFKSGIEIFNVFHPLKRRNLNAGAIPKHFLINDTSSRQAMQNVDGFKWRNNLNVEANASNASVRKRPKVDKTPTTSKRKKFDSTEPSMEVTSTIQETIDIHQAVEEAIFDPLRDVMNENVAVAVEGSTVAPSMEATSTIQETIDIHQAVEEAIFDPLRDVMNENFAVVIEDSTVTSPSMEATSTIQETIDIHQAAEEAIFDYFESKRLKNLLLAEASANVKKNKKLAKLA